MQIVQPITLLSSCFFIGCQCPFFLFLFLFLLLCVWVDVPSRFCDPSRDPPVARWKAVWLPGHLSNTPRHSPSASPSCCVPGLTGVVRCQGDDIVGCSPHPLSIPSVELLNHTWPLCCDRLCIKQPQNSSFFVFQFLSGLLLVHCRLFSGDLFAIGWGSVFLSC